MARKDKLSVFPCVVSVLRRMLVYAFGLLRPRTSFCIFLKFLFLQKEKEDVSRQGDCLYLPFSLGLLGNQFCVVKFTKKRLICNICRDFLWGVHFGANVINVELLIMWFVCSVVVWFCGLFVLCFSGTTFKEIEATWHSFGLGGCPRRFVWDRQKRWSARKIKALLQQFYATTLFFCLLEVLPL